MSITDIIVSVVTKSSPSLKSKIPVEETLGDIGIGIAINTHQSPCTGLLQEAMTCSVPVLNLKSLKTTLTASPVILLTNQGRTCRTNQAYLVKENYLKIIQWTSTRNHTLINFSGSTVRGGDGSSRFWFYVSTISMTQCAWWAYKLLYKWQIVNILIKLINL